MCDVFTSVTLSNSVSNLLHLLLITSETIVSIVLYNLYFQSFMYSLLLPNKQTYDKQTEKKQTRGLPWDLDINFYR